MQFVIAIDAGTTGVRSLVVDHDGTVEDLAYRELTQYFPRPGWVEHDPQEIWSAVRETLDTVAHRLAGHGHQVAAIGITNQRETVVAWDRTTGVPRHRAIVWQDRRTADRCDELRSAGYLPLVRARTGLVLDPYFSATKMEWLLTEGAVSIPRSPEALALGTVDSWVLWQLTGGAAGHPGAVFATDVTNASRTMLLDTTTLSWSEELCALFGVPPGALAEVRPSCGRFGTVAGATLQGPGLSGAGAALDGVPISGIAGDQQAALFGQACFDPGMVKITYGTGSFVLAQAGPTPPPAPEGLLATVAWDLGEHGDHRGSVAYALEGSTFVSGAAIQWLRDGLGIIERAEELGPLAATVENSGGVTMVPAFAGLGSPWWDPRARGTITGITRGTGRAELARAVLEALAYQVRDILEAMAGAGVGVGGRSAELWAELRVDGGAAAMDALLQLQADQVGSPVARPRAIESTALGAAMLAGLAEGVWGSLEELSARWEPEATFTPTVDPAVADAAYAGWLRAVDRSRRWSET